MFSSPTSSTQLAGPARSQRVEGLLDRHDALAERQIARYDGRLVKTTGDGVLATFDGPARSVRCAQAICEGARALGLEVRAGIHTGEVELRENDIAGLGVNIAARIEALAQPVKSSSPGP